MGILFSACCRKQAVVERETASNLTPASRIETVPSAEAVAEESDTDTQGLNDVCVQFIDLRPTSASETEHNADSSEEGKGNADTAATRGAEEKADSSQDVDTATAIVIEELMGDNEKAACGDVTNEKGGSEISSTNVTTTDGKPEANTETVGTGDIVADVSPVKDSQFKAEPLNVPTVVPEAKVKKVRPKAAKGPRAMPRSSVSMENGGLRWSRYMDEVNSTLQDSSPLLDRRFRPKAAKGCRTPMVAPAAAVVNQHALSFGDRPIKIRRPQLTVETEKSADDKALERWSERVLQGCGQEDKDKC